MQDIGAKTRSSLLWSTSLKIVYQVFRFAISIIIARILDPRDFGIMGIGTMIIMYADNISSLGFNRALVYKKDISEKHINSVFTLNLTISIFLTLLIILLSSRIAGFFDIVELSNVLLSLSCVFIISSFYQMPMTLMKRRLNFKVVALADLFRGIMQSLVTLILAFLNFGYWALVIGFIVSNIFGVIYIYTRVRWVPKIKYDHAAMKHIFNFGLWNFIRVQTIQINEHADKFIIAKFLGPVLLGFYEKAFSTVAMQKSSFTKQINSVMFSSFSRLQSETNDKIKKYLKKAITVTSLITFPINMGLIALGAHFVLVLLGDKWEPMITPLKIFAIAFVFNNLTGLCASLNIGTGNYVKQTVREGTCNILLICVCLFAVNYGIEYVALGVLLVYGLTFFISFQLTKKHIEMSWKDLSESIVPAAAGSLVMLTVIMLLEKTVFVKIDLVNFILLSIIGVVVYLSMIFIPKYQGLEEYRKSLISRVKTVLVRLFALSKG